MAEAPVDTPEVASAAPRATSGEEDAVPTAAAAKPGARQSERVAPAHRGHTQRGTRHRRAGKERRHREALASTRAELRKDSVSASAKEGDTGTTAGKRVTGVSPSKDSKGSAGAAAEAAPPSPRDQARDHVRAGNSFARQGKWKAAATEYEKAVLLDDRNALAHRGLGVAYAGMKRAKEAIREYELYLKLAPKARDAQQVKAIIDAYYAKQK